ncbi:MAG: hypothetical protein NVV59_05240 [Chitinophagaceae bacterium]|nr:hypothetical protein [Chitinophagaceae bacterium]
MQKYQVTIDFEMRDNFVDLIPPHRTYINYLINKEVIDQYVVSMETHQVWITINADSKKGGGGLSQQITFILFLDLSDK